MQASEKVYQSFLLEAKNKGGHSSLPSKDNAIYQLATGLERLSKFDFPVNLNEVTRGYFQKMSAIETGQSATDMKAVAGATSDAEAVKRLSDSPYYNALMRIECRSGESCCAQRFAFYQRATERIGARQNARNRG